MPRPKKIQAEVAKVLQKLTMPISSDVPIRNVFSVHEIIDTKYDLQKVKLNNSVAIQLFMQKSV